MDKVKGTVVWKFEDHFNADRIVGSKNIGEKNIDILGKVCLADFDPDFVNRVRRGDIMVAARNFGYGHPHQQSIQSIKKVGISTVIAESFYPAWYRMAFFHNLPVMICPDIAKFADIDHELEVDFVSGKIKNLTTGKTIQAEPIPPFLLEVLNAGGLVSWLRKQPVPAKQ
jgi:3-isopropylmalate/(R)-2-methylmalate dehydratase small subunit